MSNTGYVLLALGLMSLAVVLALWWRSRVTARKREADLRHKAMLEVLDTRPEGTVTPKAAAEKAVSALQMRWESNRTPRANRGYGQPMPIDPGMGGAGHVQNLDSSSTP